MKAFDVFLPSDDDRIDLFSDFDHPYTVEGMTEPVLIDTIFGSDSLTAEEVEHSLIFHDGYPETVWVEEAD